MSWSTIGKFALLPVALSCMFISQMAFSKDFAPIKLRYFGVVKQPLKLMLVGGNDAFRANLKSIDTQGIIDHNFQPKFIDDADLILIFLNSWDDADLLGEGWEFLKSSLKSIPKKHIQYFALLTIRDNVTKEERNLVVTVFNAGNLIATTYSCFSRDILNRFTLPDEEYEKDNVAHCK